MKADIDKYHEDHKKGQGEIGKKLKQLEKVEYDIFELENILTESVENTKEKDIMKRLLNIPGFKGTIQEKVNPSAAKYEICFQMMTNHINKYLLCSTEKSSQLVGEKLKEMSLLKTVVIL